MNIHPVLISSLSRHVHGLFRTVRFRAINNDMKKVVKLEKLIKQHTCITRNYLTPEIALHLITPSSSLWTLPIEHIPFKDPFWAFYWPGGQALARFILDNPGVVRNRKVLDIGSGCGATAIAAAMSNARNVIANDIDPAAGCAISLNCSLNNVNITVSIDQIIGNSENISDCILVGDMFYDDAFASILIEWLKMLRAQGKHIFVGDPGRLAFMKYEEYFKCLTKYPLSYDDFTPGFSNVLIWKMK